MSDHGSRRALVETGANPANAAIAARMTPDRTQAAIARILRTTPGKVRPGPSEATRAAVRGRTEGAKARAAAREARETPGERTARRQAMLDEARQQPLSPDAKEHRANWQRAVQGNTRTKPETASARAMREGQTRQPQYTPEQQRALAGQSRLASGRNSGARYTLTASEKRDYTYLKDNEEKLQQDVAQYTQLAEHPPEPEDRRFGQLMAHAAQAQLNLLDAFRTRLGEGKAAAAAARAARLAPLRAHLAGLKGASRQGAEGVNDWLRQKYPEMAPMLNRTYGEKPMSASVARRIAASFATLEHEFPSAGARMEAIGINRSASAPSGLIHSTKRLGDGFRDSMTAGHRAIGISPTIGQRGALKSAPRGANGKPMTVEAMMRQAFAPAVERDLQALPADSEGGKAYAKWAARYPGADFARAFTAIAYGRGGKGQRGAARDPEVRALKRALAVAYPQANLTQKPITPTS